MVQSVSSSASSALSSTQDCGDVKTAIAVKLFKANQESQQIAGDLIQDTVNISQEAINACKSEKS